MGQNAVLVARNNRKMIGHHEIVSRKGSLLGFRLSSSFAPDGKEDWEDVGMQE